MVLLLALLGLLVLRRVLLVAGVLELGLGLLEELVAAAVRLGLHVLLLGLQVRALGLVALRVGLGRIGVVLGLGLAGLRHELGLVLGVLLAVGVLGVVHDLGGGQHGGDLSLGLHGGRGSRRLLGLRRLVLGLLGGLLHELGLVIGVLLGQHGGDLDLGLDGSRGILGLRSRVRGLRAGILRLGRRLAPGEKHLGGLRGRAQLEGGQEEEEECSHASHGS
mmetsp:Transcript_67903/g.199418  ORF Transcript_67903/g.199418 Transcript_67903/m.199418 type:complete len:220 (+) Transcript_67903:479-1138(+)